MGDLQLVFLQYVGKAPSLAGCAKCRLKFFTPEQLLKQPEAAAQYLREKFSLHTCKWEIVEETGSSLAQKRHLRVVKPYDGRPPVGICEGCTMRFETPVYLRDHADQAESDIRRRFSQHRCRRRDAN